MPRVLVVEDERKVLRGLERGLGAEGYEALAAAAGEEGLRLALTQSPDCVVLDLMLPGRPGLEVLAELRRAGLGPPVLVPTARDAVEDRVTGLDAGPHDSLVQPLSLPPRPAPLPAPLRP